MSARTLEAMRAAAGALAALLLVGGCSFEANHSASGEEAAPAGLGRQATPQEIAAWDVDVDARGRGLPAGTGTAARGATLFAERCAVCHGTEGQGQGMFPRLIGREPRTGFPFGRDPRLPRTIGNYWPYSTTLYDYIHRAMPQTAPGSLTPDETYALVAFLLARNEVIPQGETIDARTLPLVRMPARDRFVRDDRGGKEFR